ncbi:rRNA methyltransferase [Clostridia bacterium]|nr:rRNA methyltransferase [Clostridia bacterium]
MRVITGTAKGRKLKTLADDSVRPTADFVKQAIFNKIQFDIEGRRVLDLFSGSGQLGIEALSRGAAFADFVDSAKTSLDVTRLNVEHCGFTDRAGLFGRDALSFLESCKQRYDLIFLDPPYKSDLVKNALLAIGRLDILREGGIIVTESSSADGDRRAALLTVGKYQLKSQRRLGRKEICIYEHGDISGQL